MKTFAARGGLTVNPKGDAFMGHTLPLLNITLGYYLDGRCYPGPLQGGEAACGRMALGPLGLTSQLETWLGLPSETVPGGLRIAQCLRAARAILAKDSTVFYAKALMTAPWACAQRLLAMRNALVLSGWQGGHPEEGGKRLKDLAALSQALPKAPDLPARLVKIIDVLQCFGLVHHLNIELIEPRETWPQCWKRLFSALDAQGVVFSSWNQGNLKNEDNTLSQVKAYLAGKDKTRVPLQADDSLIVLRTETVDEAAETVARLLPACSAKGSTVLLRTDPGIVLEEALRRFHQPTTGFAPESRWRSLLQLLPICLRMRWAPRSMQTLLDFLLLPLAPVPAKQRLLLADALQKTPGIGNELWQEKAAEVRDQLRKADAATAEQKWQEYLQWILPEEVEENEGMPLSVIEDVCSSLSAWARELAKTSSYKGLLKVLASQADDFLNMAREAGETSFSRPTLEAMLDHECALGADTVFSIAEEAPWDCVDHPGKIHGPLDTLIWWQFRDPASSQRHLWSEGEEQWLSAHEQLPTSSEEKHLLNFLAWKRALQCTCRQAILVLPEWENGEEITPHPFLDFITAAFKGDNTLAVLSKNPAELSIDPKPTYRNISPLVMPDKPNEPLCVKALPVPKEISFSTADTILKCPFHGLFLTSPLRFHAARSSALPSMSAFLGDFSHCLVQHMLMDPERPQAKDAAEYMKALVNRFIPTHAAVLLERCNQLIRQNFTAGMEIVARALCERLSLCGFSEPKVEENLKRKLKDRATILRGRADVMLKASSGKTVIWDMKWSYGKKKYLGMLEQGTAFQLAAYAWMAGNVVDAAYWLLPVNAFLGTKGSGASGSGVCDLDFTAMWDQLSEELEARFQEWEEGCLAIAGQGGNGNAQIDPGCDYCDLSFVCGRGYA